MPRKGGKLTRQESIFAKAYSSTGDAQYSAVSAGLAVPHASGYKTLARPAVKAEIEKISLARMENEVVPLAIKRHLEILNDAASTGQVLNRAIEMAYKYGLKLAGSGAQKEAHEMTAEELASAISLLERVAGDRATVIRSAPAPSEPDNVFA